MYSGSTSDGPSEVPVLVATDVLPPAADLLSYESVHATEDSQGTEEELAHVHLTRQDCGRRRRQGRGQGRCQGRGRGRRQGRGRGRHHQKENPSDSIKPTGWVWLLHLNMVLQATEEPHAIAIAHVVL